jgi:hypothetical protein
MDIRDEVGHFLLAKTEWSYPILKVDTNKSIGLYTSVNFQDRRWSFNFSALRLIYICWALGYWFVAAQHIYRFQI